MVAGILKWLEGLGVNTAYVLFGLGGLLIFCIYLYINVQFARIFGFAIALSPLWLPVILFLTFFEKWKGYVKKDFLLNQGNVTLEILLPEEILKSPLAMELVIAQLYQKASPDNLVQTYIDGKHPPVFSLELVSDGGRVRFFINTPRKKFKNLIEAQLYSQYPGIEVRELAVDYTAEIDKDLTEFSIFSLHFSKKPNVTPIKTYIDYKLDMNPEEEEKIDPITQQLDMLGSISPDERIWIQIIITAHREESFKVGSLTTTPDWSGDLKAEINKLAMRDDKKMGVIDLEASSMPRMTDGERLAVAALEKRQSQSPFTTGIRAIYAVKKGKEYLLGERIGAIITSWVQYNGMNAIGIKWRTDVDWPWWQDPKGTVRDAMKKRELDEYKRRYYEAQGQNDVTCIMTPDELATIFHLPGKVAVTPTLPRIPSARAEAPPNLPVGEF